MRRRANSCCKFVGERVEGQQFSCVLCCWTHEWFHRHTTFRHFMSLSSLSSSLQTESSSTSSSFNSQSTSCQSKVDPVSLKRQPPILPHCHPPSSFPNPSVFEVTPILHNKHDFLLISRHSGDPRLGPMPVSTGPTAVASSAGSFSTSTTVSNGNAGVNSSQPTMPLPPLDLTPEEQNMLREVRRRKLELTYEIEQLKDEISRITLEMSKLAPKEEAWVMSKQKNMTIGKKRFNMDPKKGIEFLIDKGVLRNTPQDVAEFLYKGEGLNKTAIGEYLGEKKDFNMAVLDAFVNAHDFTNLLLVQALRQFLWSFRLPGEAQKIDRMMEKFASRYCSQNPGVFSTTDTCYVLSFSIIMLNTGLHNPSVKDKPTLEKFITMNRGINNGGDLPRELLASLYESIKQEPFKIPEDDGNDLMHTFFNPDREGWLWKQGGRYKSWKRRWFILNDKCLYYFEYTTDKEPRGIIPLENVSVREVTDKGKPNCFELYSSVGPNEVIKACKTDAEGRVSEGRHTAYRMYSATAEEKDAWIKAIKQSISHNPYYDMLAARKKKAQLY